MEWRKIMDEHFHPYTQYPHNPQNGRREDSFTDITDITHKGQKVQIVDEEEDS